MLNEGTKNQLSWSENHNKVVGIRFDYRSGISTSEYPVYINYTNNKEYWNELEEITINQGEFNSLGLGFMHFMSPELSYDKNPYKVMQVWVDIGGENKEKMIGVQQIYYDSIKCKLIGTPEQIEGVKMHKRFEEDITWEDELAKVREYSANDFHRSKVQLKRMASNSGGIDLVEVTSIDDYDIEYEIQSDWKTYKRALRSSKRTQYLEEQLEKIEEKTLLMEDWEKQLYKILAIEYGVNSFDIDERHLLADAASDIAYKFDTHPAEVWKAFWVYIEPWVRKELEWLENNL